MRILILLALLLATPALAQDKDPFRSTEFPLPRFVSLSSGKAYVRSGPGKKYPIQWVFQRKRLPVEIILEFEHWRKIRDVEGQEGWLHKSLLSGKRTAIIKAGNQISLFSKPQSDTRINAYLEPNLIVNIKECSALWCRVDASGYKGWVEQKKLWGVYANEVIED